MEDAPEGLKVDADINTGVPDLSGLPVHSNFVKKLAGQHPELASDQIAAKAGQRFDDAATEYWDGELDDHTSRRLRQQTAIAKSLREEARVMHAAGHLTNDALAVVNRMADARRDGDDHNAYRMTVAGSDGTWLPPLDGVLVLTRSPGGMNYAQGRVTDRQASTGVTVLYVPGRDGGLREFTNLATACQWFSDQLTTDRKFQRTVLSRQAPATAAALRAVIDHGAPQTAAGLLRGPVAFALADGQIQAWNANARTPSESYRVGPALDTGLSDGARRLVEGNALAARIIHSIAPGVPTDTPPSPALLASLARSLRSANAAAQLHPAPMGFDAFARQQVQQRLKEHHHLDIDPASVRVDVVQWPDHHGAGIGAHTSRAKTTTLSLVEYVAQKMEHIRPFRSSIQIQPVAAGVTAEVIQALTRDLSLEQAYSQYLSAHEAVPTEPAAAARFNAGVQATMDATRDRMDAQLLIAASSKLLDAASVQRVQQTIDHPDEAERTRLFGDQATRVTSLTFRGETLRDVMVFRTGNADNCVLYVPGSPDGRLFRSYPDGAAMLADIHRELSSMASCPDNPGQWQPQATYWFGQLGRHQAAGRAALRQFATQPVISPLDVGEWKLDGHLFQRLYQGAQQRLLQIGDASARTDAEVTGENALAYAQAIFQLAAAVPSPLSPILMATDILSKLFVAYSAWNHNEQDAAADALFDALTNLVTLLLVEGTGRMLGSGGASIDAADGDTPTPAALAEPESALIPTADGGMVVQSLQPAGDTAGFRQITSGEFAGLYYQQGRPEVYHRSAPGTFHRVFRERDTGTFRLGDPDTWRARSSFHPYPELTRGPAGTGWSARPAPGLRGGHLSDSDPVPTMVSAEADAGAEVFHDAEEDQFHDASTRVEYSAAESQYMRAQQPYRNGDSHALGTYNRASNGKYPLRDAQDHPIRITKISKTGKGRSGAIYSSDAVKPYIRYNDRVPEDIARLYESRIVVRPFTEDDVTAPGERALIGQNTVVAARDIKAGEIIGVYSGKEIAKHQVLRNDPFVMDAGTRLIKRGTGTDEEFREYVTLVDAVTVRNLTPTEHARLLVLRDKFSPPRSSAQPIYVSGDGAVSRINTRFEYDAQGVPVRQADTGYNAEFASFEIDAAQPEGAVAERELVTVFATQDIPAGTQLHINYGYSEETIAGMFKPATPSSSIPRP